MGIGGNEAPENDTWEEQRRCAALARQRAALAESRQSMPQWSAWIDRARQFIASLRRLGAEMETTFTASPPLAPAELDGITGALPNPLPASLRAFLEQGCAEFTIS